MEQNLSPGDRNLYRRMLEVAREEAEAGLTEGGVPVGAAIFTRAGELVSRGRNRRVQLDDPSIHGETDAFRRAGRNHARGHAYRDLVMVTTLAPCWYCSGLIRQFGFRTVVVGESRNFQGGVEWLREAGVEIIDLDDPALAAMMAGYIASHPEIWNEDIGR